MATRRQHHGALHDALDIVLARSDDAPSLRQRLGLSPTAARSLSVVRRAPDAFEVGFDDHCNGNDLPRRLRSPIDGTPIPVRAVRSATQGTAHAITLSSAAEGAGFGTLGAVLRDDRLPSQLYALTAGHVVATHEGCARGDLLWFRDSNGEASFSGLLIDWIPRFVQDQEAMADAAIAAIQPGALQEFLADDAEWPTGVSLARRGDALQLRSPRGVIDGIGSSMMSCRMAVAGTGLVYTLRQVLSWNAPAGTQPGDSGAAVWNDREQLVGIHAGTAPGEPYRALMVPIDRILRHFNSSLVVRGEALDAPLPPPTPAPPQPLPAAASGPLRTPAGHPLPEHADILARTLWGEARGEQEAGMRAVACVVLNRAARRNYWGADVTAVCRKPYQFSCWNPDDPNLRKVLEVTRADAQFVQALAIAAELLSDARGLLRPDRDPTHGATHYHARALMPPPRWALNHIACARIGKHLFYNDIR